MGTAEVLELENQEIYLVHVDWRQQIGVNLIPKGAKTGKGDTESQRALWAPSVGPEVFNASTALSKSPGHAQGWN